MKAISLGLISSIIFSIVLAKNSSDSGSTTGCFGFCRKKPKKAHKTTTAEPVKVKEEKPFDPKIPNLKFIDEFDPITLEAPKGRQSMLDEPFISETDGLIIDKVTGFSRRENNSSVSGWYIRPYEEDYEDKIKVNFIPYREYYERKQQNAHKQHSGPHPVPKIPEKQEVFKKKEMPVYQKLSTINEEDSNALDEDKENDENQNDEVYNKHKGLLCTDPEEIKQAEKLMDEAVTHLEHYATSEDGYKSYKTIPNSQIRLYKKKHKRNTDIEKVCYTIDVPDQYNETIKEIWDPSVPNMLNKSTSKIVRVYNPYLVMIQQRYEKNSKGHQKYFYALAKRAEISKDKTIIAMTSANINDHHPSDKKYKNTIIENANLFKTDIDSEDDIRKGTLEKVFVNIAGYLIEKKDNKVEITYIESVDGHSSIYQEFRDGNLPSFYFLRT
ncbi:fam-a protein [Plasmodium vinckei lentum]|uniref:Fam-a protein n=1 Tax=Plasmodium vinckei lentum TaxID=138297 RepID=A0A6V7SGC5_PLAVN|nr:fam-a protein [Plasmodium vinckei lentum]